MQKKGERHRDRDVRSLRYLSPRSPRSSGGSVGAANQDDSVLYIIVGTQPRGSRSDGDEWEFGALAQFLGVPCQERTRDGQRQASNLQPVSISLMLPGLLACSRLAVLFPQAARTKTKTLAKRCAR